MNSTPDIGEAIFGVRFVVREIWASPVCYLGRCSFIRVVACYITGNHS